MVNEALNLIRRKNHLIVLNLHVCLEVASPRYLFDDDVTCLKMIVTLRKAGIVDRPIISRWPSNDCAVGIKSCVGCLLRRLSINTNQLPSPNDTRMFVERYLRMFLDTPRDHDNQQDNDER